MYPHPISAKPYHALGSSAPAVPLAVRYMPAAANAIVAANASTHQSAPKASSFNSRRRAGAIARSLHRAHCFGNGPR